MDLFAAAGTLPEMVGRSTSFWDSGRFLGAFAVSSQFQGILHSFMKHGPGLSRCIFY